MKNRTPFLTGFGPLLFGKAPVSALARLAKLQSMEDLYSAFAYLFDEKSWDWSSPEAQTRDRQLPGCVTFWAFVSQILTPGSSCREVVRKLDAWWRWGQGKARQTVTASAYCQARQRLNLSTLEHIGQGLSIKIESRVPSSDQWINQRSVKIIDGTMLTMPDEPSLQARWPQHHQQKTGCGFPIMRLVGIFSLSSGAILASAQGSHAQSEVGLFKALWPKLQRGDIILEDRGFCSFGSMVSLLGRGIDTVCRLAVSRKQAPVVKILGPGDQLICWTKSRQARANYEKSEWEALPQTLLLRQIEIVVQAKGFRTKRVTIVTTLCDAEIYPADRLRCLYGERWQVELHFAQLKTWLDLDVLSCKSPEMIEKELQIHLIAYNLVRSVMQRAASTHHVPLKRISFKGTLDTLRHYAPQIHRARHTSQKQRALIDQMLLLIAQDLVPFRPERSEPRAVKKRPKNYHRLTKPRKEIGNLPHTNKSHKKSNAIPIPS